ncbi:MAG: hypothetical protein KF901_09170 [Myxococcales bacterium]|nr:hypothetical protein [Myxococcales bacterium]
MRTTLFLLLALTPALTSARPSAAQPAPDARLEVRLMPLDAHGPWKRRLVIQSPSAQEVVLDRRLLELTVLEPRERGRPRRHTCRHPDAPRRPVPARVEAMEPGAHYEEWVDLRMYCWGAALAALTRSAATVEIGYGFRARGAFVARQPDERRPPHRVAGEGFEWAPPATPSDEGDVRVRLRPVTTRGAPTLAVELRGTGEAARKRVYLRDDLFSFEVRGPLGTARCRPTRTTIVPIVDFYRALSRQSATTLSVAGLCPPGTFDVPGVYEVTPVVDLVYDGTRYELDALTGRFEGPPAPVRITGGAYVIQRVDDLPAPDEAG